MATTTLTRFLTSRLKPHRTEAIARIRFNTLSLLILLLLTSTVPGLPSLPTAIGVVIARRMFWSGASSSRSPATTRGKGGKGGGNKWNGGGHVAKRWDYAVDVYPPPQSSESSSSENAYAYLCLFITSLTAIFLFNIFESFYALKYPRTQNAMTLQGTPNPLGALSPAQKKRGKLFDGVRIWGGGVGSPGSSPSNPQPQKPFSFSSSPSTSTYPLSPLSTPSRSMHYTPLSTPRSSLASSSSSSVMYTPSPPNAVGGGVGGLSASAYRGRAFGGSVARPLDGSYLGRIVKTEPDSDDEL